MLWLRLLISLFNPISHLGAALTGLVILTRQFSLETYGLYALITANASVISFGSSLGSDRYLLSHIPNADLPSLQQIFTTTMVLQVGCYLIALLVSLGLYQIYPGPLWGYTLFYSVAMLFSKINDLFYNVLNLRRQNIRANVVVATERILFTLVLVALYQWQQITLIEVCWLSLISYALASLYFILTTGRQWWCWQRFSWALLKNIVGFSMQYYPLESTRKFYPAIVRYLTSLIFSPAMVALVAVCQTAWTTASQLLLTVINLLFPYYSKNNDSQKQRQLLSWIWIFSLAAGLWGICLWLVFPEQLVQVLGKNYQQITQYRHEIALMIVASFLLQFFNTILVYHKKLKRVISTNVGLIAALGLGTWCLQLQDAPSLKHFMWLLVALNMAAIYFASWATQNYLNLRLMLIGTTLFNLIFILQHQLPIVYVAWLWKCLWFITTLLLIAAYSKIKPSLQHADE